MALIGMQDVSVGFGGEPLLKHMDLHIESGERICLLGRNGVGKSTLIKLITGQLTPDSGTLSRTPMVTITSLTQDVPAKMTGTVFDQVAAGLGPQGKQLAEYHLLSHRIAEEPNNKALLNQLDKLGHQLDRDDGWQINRHVEAIIEKVTLDPDAEVASLSAGMKRRVLLAQALVRQPDILLLDEPTNHLDIETVIWIEEFLERYKGSLVFVSHDRAFIKKLATRIIELDRGRLRSYFCNYETYLQRKKTELDAEAVENALFDKKLAQEEIWIRSGIKARRTRNEGRVRALKKLREQRSQRKELTGTAKLSLQEAQRSGRLVVEAKNISFNYKADQPIMSNFSTIIMRGDKIGIMGPNGSGKTTLLRVLLNELKTQQGSIRHGVNLEIAYFDQLHAQLDYSKSVYENVADGNETVYLNGNPRHIVGYLQDFLFTPAQSRNPVSNLSGGERNRLLLARLFAKPSNVLVLDEPTNDLDMETLDLLEEFLMNYPGTVLMVSHDREFLNNVVTSILAMEGNGNVREYGGGYDDWLNQRTAEKNIQAEKSPVKQAKQKPAKQKTRRLSFKEKKELEQIPALIETLEEQQRQLHEMMSQPDFYKQGAKVATTTNKLKDLNKQIEDLYDRWHQLEEINADM